ncbi:hypothetical protein, partial [Roseiconus nitratireducens]|uniref:hypothetical protein n=1 Tax=Roseiconus nitratireducens TaxID=2605748 RepID=UPI001F29FC5A
CNQLHSFASGCMKSLLRRLRPRFSIRTLLILPLLVAVYFALDAATKRYGPDDVARVFEAEHGGGLPGYVAPLIFEHWTMNATAGPNASPNSEVTAHYYVWFFGYVWRTPYVRVQPYTMRGPQSAKEMMAKTSWAKW